MLICELENHYLTKEITWDQLTQIEKHLDKVYKPLGIDVSFSRHFADRANDPRNGKHITVGEIIKVFADVYRKYAKKLMSLHDQEQAVMTDLSTLLNIPFVMNWNHRDNEFDMVAKTIMRKPDFHSADPKLVVEKSFETEHGLTVLDNPTQAELLAFFNNRMEGGYMKGVVVGNETYWWDAYFGTHAYVSKDIGVEFNESNHLYLSMRPKIDTINPCISFDEVDNPDLIQHPVIQRLLKDDKIKIYYAVDKAELNED